MATRERTVDRGERIARSDLRRVSEDIRLARINAGLSLAEVGRAVGLSRSQVSRVEGGSTPGAPARHLARIGSVVGLDVRLRSYPGPDPIRDQAQVRALQRFRTRLPGPLPWRYEVTLGIEGDLRAWDACIDLEGEPGSPLVSIPVEVETRIADIQAVLRRLSIKCRDAGVTDVILVVADTRANRAAIEAAGAIIKETFPIPAKSAWASLHRGRTPGGSTLFFI